MASRPHRFPDLVTDLGPTSGHLVKLIFNANKEHLNPHTTYIADTHLNVRVNQPSVILATQFTPESQPCQRYDTNLQIKHTAFEPRSLEPLVVHVHNPTDRPIPTTAEPLSMYVYALPLDPVTPPELILRQGESHKRRTTVADAVVQQIDDKKWHTRLTASRLVWSRNQSRYTANSVYHTTSFIFNSQQMPLGSMNTASELVCSIPHTHVTNIRKISKDEVKVYLECLQEDTPETKCFVHLAWENSNHDIVMNRNPKPYLRAHDRNGFTILCPQTLHLKPGKTSHLMFDVCFESDKYVAIICPRTIPGISMSCNPLLPLQNLFMEIKAVHESLYIEQYEELGWLYFFDRKMILTKGTATEPAQARLVDQHRLMAKLEYHHVYGDQADDESGSSASDSDMEVFRHPPSGSSARRPSQPPASSSSRKPSSSAASSTMTTRSKHRVTKAETSDESEEDDDDRETLVFSWPNWQCGIKSTSLVPIVASAHGDRLPYQDFPWGEGDDYRTFSGIEIDLQPYQTQRRRRHTRLEPIPESCTVSVPKKHRS
ncbi:Rh112 [macacine betaherpesvirus 3]|nr:Rh112 [macacine betaherpesvirus 3]APT40171.1 Rh112 [macacine betaherpesvirus 3]